jgi:hypothetical protein
MVSAMFSYAVGIVLLWFIGMVIGVDLPILLMLLYQTANRFVLPTVTMDQDRFDDGSRSF